MVFEQMNLNPRSREKQSKAMKTNLINSTKIHLTADFA